MFIFKTSLSLSRCAKFVRRFSTQKSWKEVKIPVPWGEIRGKWWGPTDIRPILALHGWQDNCGTFDRLIPLLKNNIGFLAIDFPGHGYSTPIPPGVYYHYTTNLLTLKFILAYLKWPKVSLMGHSMGGITAYTYTMLYPDHVDFLACLDGMKPLLLKKRVATMAKSIDSFMKSHEYSQKSEEPPSYTLDEIKKKVHAPNHGSINLEYTPFIIKRNIAPSKINPGKYYFTRDPRLKSGEIFSHSQEELVEQAQHIRCPIFLTKAKGSSYFEAKENFYEVLDVLKRSSIDCDHHYVEGTHHEHLNNPEEIVRLLQNFIQRHNTEDRSIGCLKDEMIVTEIQEPQMKIS